LYRFDGMTVLKPNEEEAAEAARAMGLPAGDRTKLAAELTGRLAARSTLVTLGNEGMLLYADQKHVRIPAVGSEEIVDLTGAGDTVAATLAAALATGADIETAARLANHAGSIVVMKEGAATASPDELRASIRTVHA
jgi:bifunctional ADP-heptose synthase (sugar kinase/adenylyltransferase)